MLVLCGGWRWGGGGRWRQRIPAQKNSPRRVLPPDRGAIMIGGQRIQVGLPHAGKTVEVTVEADTYQITVEDGIAVAAPRKTSRAINRHKASDYG